MSVDYLITILKIRKRLWYNLRHWYFHSPLTVTYKHRGNNL